MYRNTETLQSSLRGLLTAATLMIAGAANMALAAPANVSFSQSAASVDAYDFVEVTINVSSPDAKNPFTDATVEAQFGKTG
ncbi:MAG: hypothetical protein ACREB3_07315, partial [Burkholderiales bacterium]